MTTKKKYTPDATAALRQFRDAKIAEQVDPAAQARRMLANHERVIQNGLQSFIEMGQALQDIRAEKLYAIDGYGDFDEYLGERWEMTPRQAYRLISAARVALILRPMGHKIDSERAARELAPIAADPDMVVAVYEEATRRAGGGRVTAALIAASRDALAPTVIDGELADNADDGGQAGSGALVEAVRVEIEDVATNQAAAVGDTSADGEYSTSGTAEDLPATGAGDQADRPAPVVTPTARPATAAPGEAEERGDSSSAADVSTPSVNQTGSEPPSPEDSGSVDGREQSTGPGVSPPAAPDPEIPSWLTAITRVSEAAYLLDGEDPDEVDDPDLLAVVRGVAEKLEAWEERPTRNRMPLPDAFLAAATNLQKAVNRLQRLVDDDRWARNAEQVARISRGDLLRSAEHLQSVIDRIPQSQ